MNSQAEFLQAISSSPNDELLLRAFADWLEEQGDPRAEWVRIPAVREWMGPNFEDPLPALVESLAQGKRILHVRRAVALIGAPAVPALSDLLRHHDAGVRLLAVRCLRKIGRAAAEAVPQLVGVLKDDNDEVREQAARAIKDIGAGKGVQTANLRDALVDQSYDVRCHAAAILGDIGAKDSVAAELVARLDGSDPAVRRTAVESLGNLKIKSVVGPLCRALGDPNAGVREAAARELMLVAGDGTPELVEPLRAALADRSETVCQRAAGGLGSIGPAAASAVPDLLRILKSKSRGVRGSAALALGSVAAGDPEVLPALVKATADPEDQVGFAAMKALDNWPSLPADHAPALLGYFERRRDRFGPVEVLPVLGRLERPTPEVLAFLREGLRGGAEPGDGYWILTQASKTLARFGPAAEEVIPDLASAVRHSYNPEPGRTLARMGPRGIAQLSDLLVGTGQAVRVRVLLGLQHAGPDAAPALPRVRECLADTDPLVQQWALLVIQATGPAANATLPDVIPLLGSREVGVRREAAAALRTLGSAEAVPALRAALRDRDEFVRKRAADALGCLGAGAAGAAAEVLRLLTDTSVAVRRAAAAALGQLRVRTAAVLAGLERAQKDGDRAVRSRAASALKKLTRK